MKEELDHIDKRTIFQRYCFYSFSNISMMNIESYRNYCLAKEGVTEEFPFDEKALVFKVMGKMFTITDVDSFVSFNVKCDPELAIELRERFVGVSPGFHMSKKHWNTIMMDGSVPDDKALEWIDHSYDLVVQKLPKLLKEELNLL